jgi:hypothetical protein
LLNNWKTKSIFREEYENRYLTEMLGQRQKEKIKELAERSKYETITVLCFEPEGGPALPPAFAQTIDRKRRT